MLKVIILVIVFLALIGGGGFFYLGVSSQSGSAPGLVEGRLAPCPDKPNCVSSEAGTTAEKSVSTLPGDTWDKLPETIEAMGGTVIKRSGSYIATEFKSKVFGFVDDVEFRKSDDGVHVRSASRVGHSDAGVNAKRVAELREMLTG